MNETKWERYGAGAGVAFVVLFVIGTFVVPMPPHFDASSSKMASYVSDHRHGLMVATLLEGFAVLAFLWFIGHLRHVLHRAEGGAEALSPIVFASGVALAAVGMMAALPLATLAFMAGHAGDTSAAVVRMLFEMNFVLGCLASLAAGLFTLAASWSMVRGEMLNTNLGWLGLLFTACLWVSGSAELFLSSYSRGLDVLNLVGVLGFCLWMLMASLAMYQHPEVERAGAHHPVFA
ncbi:MAG TPA: DUF4386 family protein [Acidimicrobiales bacterium]|nr:DUF4386 family protein [Acidimicrobiales bacterium]